MKNVPKREPRMVAMRVHMRPAPIEMVATPVAIPVRLTLLTNQIEPRLDTLPWRSSLGTQSMEWDSMPGGWIASGG